MTLTPAGTQSAPVLPRLPVHPAEWSLQYWLDQYGSLPAALGDWFAALHDVLDEKWDDYPSLETFGEERKTKARELFAKWKDGTDRQLYLEHKLTTNADPRSQFTFANTQTNPQNTNASPSPPQSPFHFAPASYEFSNVKNLTLNFGVPDFNSIAAAQNGISRKANGGLGNKGRKGKKRVAAKKMQQWDVVGTFESNDIGGAEVNSIRSDPSNGRDAKKRKAMNDHTDTTVKIEEVGPSNQGGKKKKNKKKRKWGGQEDGGVVNERETLMADVNISKTVAPADVPLPGLTSKECQKVVAAGDADSKQVDIKAFDVEEGKLAKTKVVQPELTTAEAADGVAPASPPTTERSTTVSGMQVTYNVRNDHSMAEWGADEVDKENHLPASFDVRPHPKGSVSTEGLSPSEQQHQPSSAKYIPPAKRNQAAPGLVPTSLKPPPHQSTKIDQAPSQLALPPHKPTTFHVRFTDQPCNPKQAPPQPPAPSHKPIAQSLQSTHPPPPSTPISRSRIDPIGTPCNSKAEDASAIAHAQRQPHCGVRCTIGETLKRSKIDILMARLEVAVDTFLAGHVNVRSGGGGRSWANVVKGKSAAGGGAGNGGGDLSSKLHQIKNVYGSLAAVQRLPNGLRRKYRVLVNEGVALRNCVAHDTKDVERGGWSSDARCLMMSGRGCGFVFGLGVVDTGGGGGVGGTGPVLRHETGRRVESEFVAFVKRAAVGAKMNVDAELVREIGKGAKRGFAGGGKDADRIEEVGDRVRDLAMFDKKVVFDFLWKDMEYVIGDLRAVVAKDATYFGVMRGDVDAMSSMELCRLVVRKEDEESWSMSSSGSGVGRVAGLARHELPVQKLFRLRAGQVIGNLVDGLMFWREEVWEWGGFREGREWVGVLDVVMAVGCSIEVSEACGVGVENLKSTFKRLDAIVTVATKDAI
ncbi:hypothetical protein HDV00_006504 [Rhizophlyctis rosea]|nr:hypothetical protein HDV00_006504 [Rhizophlyctis rosea]